MKREERRKQEKGITMLALVIMIIVLLILASVTIAGLTADNGVIKEATTAKEQAEKAGLEEQIELALVKVESKYRNPTIDNVIEELKNRKIISKDEQVDRETGDIITKGYKIEGKLEDYIGKVTTGNTTGGNNTSGSGNTTGGNSSSGGNTTGGNTSGGNTTGGNTTGGNSTGGGEIAVPDLKDSEVNFTLSKDDWTNQSITVEIACSVTGYTLQYSTNGRDWNNYTNAVQINENGYVYARLTNNSGKTGGSVRKQITNIDKLLPKQFTPTATSTTNSITLTGSTVDAEQTETNGISGIDKYYFSKDNGATWEPSNGQTGTSYTFNNLTQNQSYSLKMKAADKAGNEVITETVNKTTGTVTDLTSSNVTFTYNPTTPTRGNVTVSISTTVTGYTLQYSTNGTKWDNYTTAITMSDNGEIHARLWDGTNAGGYATGNVANIDRLAPNQFTPTATSTSRTITLTGSTTDANKTATDGCSGIDKYYFSKDNGTTWEPAEGQVEGSYTFSGLTPQTTYNLKMKAVDKAGNEVVTNAITKATTQMVMPSTDDTKPYLPTGSTIINDDLDTGVVIKDSNNNEWVWIEVPKSIYATTTTSTNYTAIETAMQNYASAYRDSDYSDTWYSENQHGFTSSTQYNNWKNSMLKSVFENGGFYIGRYEVGTQTERYKRSDDATLTTPLIQRDKYPYTLVMCRQAQILAKRLATGGKTSSLMFGIQWDLIMKFIEVKREKTQLELMMESSSWGNYSDSEFRVNRGQYSTEIYVENSWNEILDYTKQKSSEVWLTTGATDRNCVLNIYDLAGGLFELTLEKHNNTNYSYVVDRGGSSHTEGFDNPAASRFGLMNYDEARVDVGFRPALW